MLTAKRVRAALAWTHLPSMPTYATLKSIGLDWAPDGRLVIVGHFLETQRDFRELLVTLVAGRAGAGPSPVHPPRDARPVLPRLAAAVIGG